jgi:hypothetical protein
MAKRRVNINPTKPIIVAMHVQDIKVVFTEISK